ncbi:MAG: hypothetical protein DDT38_01633 [Firmicutes bacterium]|nr:hypothetical protein [candidate division NPL-UPA2 bacterium]
MAMFKLGLVSMRPVIPTPPADFIATGTPTITVSGAGSTGVNGAYTWSAANNRWERGSFVVVFDSALLYTFTPQWWVANPPDPSGLYRNPGGNPTSVPRGNWITQGGVAPPPTLS